MLSKSFAASLALLSMSCHSTQSLLEDAPAHPPALVGKHDILLFECTFFSAPDDFELLKNTSKNHVAGVFSTEDGDRLIKQLKRRRKFELMSAPSVVSRQGQSAKVEIIREFIYPTEFDPPKIREVKKEFDTVSGSFPVTPATPTKFGKKDVGFTAEFKGRRTSGGGIDVQFNIGQVSFLGFVNYGSPISTTAQTARGRPVNIVLTENKIVQPVFGTKRLASRVTFPNGHYIAIGGIRQETQKSLDDNIHPTPGQIEEDKNLFALIKVTAVKP